MPKTNVRVKLVGEDGNAFSIIGRVSQALRRGGHADLVDEFREEAMSGDYNHLLATCLEYVEEESWEEEEEEYNPFNDDYDDDDN